MKKHINWKKAAKYTAILLMIRLQYLAAGAGGYLLITHFKLYDENIAYIGLGLISILIFMIGCVPLPTDRERDMMKRIVEEETK